jgi:Xaa-Pro aminopeptidase
VDRVAPKTIAVNVAADTAAADGLTASLRDGLLAALGPHAARVVSAEPLVIDYLETRLPEERPLFEEAAALTSTLWEEAFSTRVITPGKTTAGDVTWHIRQRIADLGLGTWFRPDLRVQRRGVPFTPDDIAADDLVIEPGDVLHVDLGVTYLDLATDYQRMAYVARPGETAPPPGLVKAMAATNRLQDLLFAEMRAGRPGFEVAAAAMARAGAEGLKAMIYSHSIGNFGHFVGASVGAFKPGARPPMRASLPLRAGAYTSIELNTRSAVPEWGGQEVWVMLEDDAWLSGEGMRFFIPRQERWLVVR